MTARYSCDGDGCDKVMAEADAYINVNVMVAYHPVLTDDTDTDLPLPELPYSGTVQFCSFDCLSGWSMGKVLDRKTLDD